MMIDSGCRVRVVFVTVFVFHRVFTATHTQSRDHVVVPAGSVLPACGSGHLDSSLLCLCLCHSGAAQTCGSSGSLHQVRVGTHLHTKHTRTTTSNHLYFHNKYVQPVVIELGKIQNSERKSREYSQSLLINRH